MKDDWHVTDVKDSSTMKPAQIFVQGDLSWDQFQMLISKSTTADLLKIFNKLEEFFSQQFKSSKKLFSSLEPGPIRKSGGSYNQAKLQTQDEVGHHRHWQKALSKIAGMKIYTLPFKLPDVGSVLGGVLELRGRHISLACFHGINFKSKSWALFSLKDPSISFVSDAQEIMEVKPGTDDQAVKRFISQMDPLVCRLKSREAYSWSSIVAPFSGKIKDARGQCPSENSFCVGNRNRKLSSISRSKSPHFCQEKIT